MGAAGNPGTWTHHSQIKAGLDLEHQMSDNGENAIECRLGIKLNMLI